MSSLCHDAEFAVKFVPRLFIPVDACSMSAVLCMRDGTHGRASGFGWYLFSTLSRVANLFIEGSNSSMRATSGCEAGPANLNYAQDGVATRSPSPSRQGQGNSVEQDREIYIYTHTYRNRWRRATSERILANRVSRLYSLGPRQTRCNLWQQTPLFASSLASRLMGTEVQAGQHSIELMCALLIESSYMHLF